MRECVTRCDLCNQRIRGNHIKVKTEIELSYQTFDICHKCEKHMVRYIVMARKQEEKDDK